MSRIRVLPDTLINQIAAGEVIERPAAAVKELIENALDAGARSLRVEIEAGGRRRIRIADDGTGMDHDDAVTAFERHATSKLASVSDLHAIVTLGFRGEALPAIASVSRLVMTTSPDGRSGTRVEIEGGRMRQVSAAPHPRGTTVEVRDLFFNTPARARFLRAASTELGHVSELVAACALSNPALNVTLMHEGRTLLSAPPSGDSRQRARQVLGEAWAGATPLSGRSGGLVVSGLLAPLSEAAGTRRQQYLYVNGRLVKDPLMAHAIGAAAASILPRGRHAALVLHLQCPAEAVDVNVHPAKAQVRFADPRAVHALIESSVQAGLRGAGAISPLVADMPARAVEIHEAVRSYMGSQGDTPEAAGPAGRHPETRSHRESDAPGGPQLSLHPEPVALGHFQESYIIAADASGLLLVDQHAAHERILYEQMRGPMERRLELERQRLLFPVTLPVPRVLAGDPLLMSAMLERFGFGCEPFGEATLAIREAPALLGSADPLAVAAALLEQMAGDPEGARSPDLPGFWKIVATIACHAAIKVRMPLSPDKMNYLISELFRTSAPLTCPHGRPSVVRFGLDQIERSFLRPASRAAV